MSTNLLVIPRVKIHNANALSSPFTIGFPALTAWLGGVHALERKLKQSGLNVDLLATGIVCHDFELQTYQGPGDFVYSIIGTGNPLEPKSEKGKPLGNAVRSSFIEEPRCHLTVSLVIETPELTGQEQEQLLTLTEKFLNSGMKLAGGDILSFAKPKISIDWQQLRNQLMPGYALLERRELMIKAMADGQDALDALLSFQTVSNTCEVTGEEQATWRRSRNQKGWLVPIATGFQGISELGQAKNQRDPDTPHRFAESIVTLGEFEMPYKLDSVEDILWFYQTDLSNNLYLCQQLAETES